MNTQLANAVSQNCGRKIHQELASRSFTDALLRLAGDRVGSSSCFLEGIRLIIAEYPHASQGQDPRAHGRME